MPGRLMAVRHWVQEWVVGRGEYGGLLQVERGGIGPIRPFGGVNRHIGRAAPGVVAWACVALLW